MRWEGRRGSENIEDRRSMRGPVVAGGGMLGLVLILIIMCAGGDPRPIMNQMQQAQQKQPQQGPVETDPEEDRLAQFVSVVLADTEEVWSDLFRQEGDSYRPPTLVIFTGQVASACGYQGSATGPFYCPLDEKVYIDLSFYEDMKTKLGAPGDFAQAYVIAHEVGHHVQKLLGISEQVSSLQQRSSKVEANELSVRLELQADYFAGVWAHHAQQNWQILEPGDIEEALTAATAIGDDRLQEQAQGRVVPESFTHGTSEQRTRWFVQGLKSGDMNAGNTFEIPYSQL
ncbi:putative neutral zinc metallopeptidase [Thalassoglobus neptunius]|uniref:Putative neutral zinc metallopeptidase n=1 Tax=Thalassoglobus neptunius TaxID=1938619 RepID=A0A5C5VQ93_9PLAN|nr:neutral zinc metallopeptidase [Thalassoglobus neptunius]TWT40105.1 putative neutral zinc metallopeptidase [Thalassoglobus neptunius]